MSDSQPGVGDCVPQPTYHAEQQCKHLQEFRTCQTSESRQPLLLCILWAISSTRTLPWNTPDFSSSSSAIDRLQPLHRESLCPPGDTLIPPAEVSLFPTTKCTNGVDRCDLFPGSEHPSSLPACGGTSTAPIPSTLVGSKTGGGRLRVSVTNQSNIRCLQLGRLSGCPRNGRRDNSHLRKSEARPGTYRSAEPDDLLAQRENRHRNYCLVLLFSSSSTQDVRSHSISIPSAPLTYTSFSYMGQNVKNVYFRLFGVCVCVGGGGASMIRLGLFCFPAILSPISMIMSNTEAI